MTRASAYPWMLAAGIGLTVWFWKRLARRDERLFIIYIAALASAFLGAKLVYLAAEGWLFWDDPQRWFIWATGKTIIGALLFGYAGVEFAKKQLGYREATGDYFAFVAPMGIVLGRVGCLLQGCCLGAVCACESWWTLRDARGQPRWPAVPVEIGFNVVMLAVFALIRWARPSLLAGELFHLYLIAYGLFRFLHEFARATPRVLGLFTGYQVAAAALVALGAIGYGRRRKEKLWHREC